MNKIPIKYMYFLHFPQVGTLDQLVGLSDDLGKLDIYVEQITRKVATYLGEVLEDQRDKLHENLLANNSEYTISKAQIYYYQQINEDGLEYFLNTIKLFTNTFLQQNNVSIMRSLECPKI